MSTHDPREPQQPPHYGRPPHPGAPGQSAQPPHPQQPWQQPPHGQQPQYGQQPHPAAHGRPTYPQPHPAAPPHPGAPGPSVGPGPGPAPKRNRAPMIALGAIAALAVVGGAVWGGMALLGGGSGLGISGSTSIASVRIAPNLSDEEWYTYTRSEHEGDAHRLADAGPSCTLRWFAGDVADLSIDRFGFGYSEQLRELYLEQHGGDPSGITDPADDAELTEHIAMDLLGLGRVGLVPPDELPAVALPAGVDGEETTIGLRHLRMGDPEAVPGSDAPPAGHEYLVRGFEGSGTALVATLTCSDAADLALPELLEQFDIEMTTER